MPADTNRRWLLARRPEGRPTVEDFELVESEIPEPAGGEVLVRTRYLSVDPYMRGRMRDRDSYAASWSPGDPLQGGVVGDVVASNHGDFAPGDVVTGRLYWADYAAVGGERLRHVDPDLAPVSTALGVLGMPGRTAYFGMLDVAAPDPGDTVVVTGAAGAVGSTAAQIAKLSGCRVVGFAGSAEKVAFLEEDLGLDVGIDYRETDDYDAALEAAAPDGVDVYFDNVGGDITDAVFRHLNVDARVAVCGQISLYNEEGRPVGPRKLWNLIAKRAQVEGFLVSDFEPRFERATRRLAGWLADGDLVYRETVTEGLENAPEAFIGLFEGENVGKQLVSVDEPTEE